MFLLPLTALHQRPDAYAPRAGALKLPNPLGASKTPTGGPNLSAVSVKWFRPPRYWHPGREDPARKQVFSPESEHRTRKSTSGLGEPTDRPAITVQAIGGRHRAARRSVHSLL